MSCFLGLFQNFFWQPERQAQNNSKRSAFEKRIWKKHKADFVSKLKKIVPRQKKHPTQRIGCKSGPYGSRTHLSALRGRRTKPIFEGTNQLKLTSYKLVLVPQGGFEPPQSEPESEVLPLHNRGRNLFSKLSSLYRGDEYDISTADFFRQQLF